MDDPSPVLIPCPVCGAKNLATDPRCAGCNRLLPRRASWVGWLALLWVGFLEAAVFAGWIWFDVPTPYFSFLLAPYCVWACVKVATSKGFTGLVLAAWAARSPVALRVLLVAPIAALAAFIGFAGTCVPVGCLSFSVGNATPAQSVGGAVALISAWGSAILCSGLLIRRIGRRS